MADLRGSTRECGSVDPWRRLALVLLFAPPLIGFFTTVGARPFWMDEVLTAQFAGERSLPALFAAVADQMDALYPVYVFVVWVTGFFQPVTEWLLRLPSFLAVLLCAWVWLRVLGKRFGFWPATVACAYVLLSPGLVWTNALEARCYGLFLLVVSLHAVVLLPAMEQRRAPTFAECLANGMLAAAAGLVHVLGLFFSGVIALVCLGWMWCGRVRGKPIVALSFVAGWLCFLPWIPAFLADADTARPWFWTLRPGLRELLLFLRPQVEGGPEFLVVVVAFACSAFLLRPRTGVTVPDASGDPFQRSGYLLGVAAALVLTGVVVWAVSQRGPSSFVGRYLIPCSAGWVVLVTAGLAAGKEWVLSRREFRGRAGRAAALAFALMLVGGLTLRCLWVPLDAKHAGAVRGDVEFGWAARGLPVVCESPHTYLPRWWYHGGTARYVLPIDWHVALGARESRHGPVDYKIARSIERIFGDRHEILEARDFFPTVDRFLLIDERDRLLNEVHAPESLFRYRELGRYPHPGIERAPEICVYLVERIAGGAGHGGTE